MNTVIIIPARSGSKGIANKNMVKIGGLSLVGRAVFVARQFVMQTNLADTVIVVDTDSKEIAEEGQHWGADVPFLRPSRLAGDTAPMVENVLYTLDRLESDARRFDCLVLLQPTSPLRTVRDIRACWDTFEPRDCPSVVSISEFSHSPDLNVRLRSNQILEWATDSPRVSLRRQDQTPMHQLNGNVYILTPKLLRKHRAFVIPGISRGVLLPPEHSIDVDTTADLDVARVSLERPHVPMIKLTNREIGPGAPCFIIAEAGVNHNGDVHLAHRLIDVAADAGASAVKFQTFVPELVASPDANKADYQVANTGVDESQLDMLRRLALPASAFRELQDHANSSNLTFLSTPFDTQSVEFLESIGVPAFKVASGELTNYPLLAYLAEQGKPLLLSTGMCTLLEILDSVEFIRAHGDPPLAVFHCVSSYPAPPSECNLRSIATMRSALGVPIGWSDHTEGIEISLAAVAMGADLIEKHYTLDRSLPGPDHRMSLEPDEFSQLVANIRAVETAMGDGDKRRMMSELSCAEHVRRSLYAARDLPVGHVIGTEDLQALRPGGGMPPSQLWRLLGRRLKVSMREGHRLTNADVVTE